MGSKSKLIHHFIDNQAENFHLLVANSHVNFTNLEILNYNHIGQGPYLETNRVASLLSIHWLNVINVIILYVLQNPTHIIIQL